MVHFSFFSCMIACWMSAATASNAGPPDTLEARSDPDPPLMPAGLGYGEPTTSKTSATISASISAAPSSSKAKSTQAYSSPKPYQSASLASSAVGTGTNTCPHVDTTTQTSTSNVYITSTAAPSGTLTTESWTSTITSTITTVSTAYLDVYSATTTTTPPAFSDISIVVIPASTTITIPTPASFTPLLCQHDYFDPTTTISPTYPVIEYPVAATSTIVHTDASIYTTTLYISTTTSTYSNPGTRTVYYTETGLFVSTRADPTSTVYAACATNNVSPSAPGNRYVGATDATIVYVPAVDAIDCCAQCQANSTCGASEFYPSNNRCFQVVLPVSSACNPRASAARVVGRTDQPLVVISNGACGQWVFQYADGGKLN